MHTNIKHSPDIQAVYQLIAQTDIY